MSQLRQRWPPQGLAGVQITSGTFAARPAFGVADRYYWATDIFVLFRDTGAAWEVADSIQYVIYDWDIWEGQDDRAPVVVAERRYWTPYQVKYTKTIDRLICVFAAVNGNVRMALYEDNGNAPDGGALVVQSASAAAVANGKNEHTVADTQLLPGLYWLAIQCSGTPNTGMTQAGRISSGGTLFLRRQDPGAYVVFPDPCPGTVATEDAPTIGVRVASVP